MDKYLLPFLEWISPKVEYAFEKVRAWANLDSETETAILNRFDDVQLFIEDVTTDFANWFAPENECSYCWWYRGFFLGIMTGVFFGVLA